MKKPALGKIALLLSPLIFFSFTSVFVLGLSIFLLNSTERSLIAKKASDTAINAVNILASGGDAVLGTSSQRLFFEDARSVIIDQFYENYGAPLAGYGKFLVTTAEKYRLPWWLLPAISMQESNGGKSIPENSYNAWGWAIHSTYTKKFPTWEAAIDRVGKGLREDYLDQGFIEPCEIMTKYTPASVAKGGPWCKGVEFFRDQMLNFKTT